jgi:hypothetical protein
LKEKDCYQAKYVSFEKREITFDFDEFIEVIATHFWDGLMMGMDNPEANRNLINRGMISKQKTKDNRSF